MEFAVNPESNPAPQASQARPDRVSDFDSPDQSQSPDLAEQSVRQAQRQSLTELTGDDIFRMKNLRPSESVSASEAAELSYSVADGTGNDDAFESPNEQRRPNVAFDPNAARDEASELNEEDIFRMKSLSLSRAGAVSEQAGNSAVSLADSTSNFAERVVEDEEKSDDTSESNSPLTMLTFSGQYVFSRSRAETPQLNKSTVTVLEYPFKPMDAPPNGISEEEFSRFFKQSKLYLVGTAHFSPESQKDVRQVVSEVQPDVVMVELCAARVSILSLDEETLLREARNLNRQKVMDIIRDGLLQVMLLSASAHITEELGMAPGGEFRAAHIASFKVPGCRLILGDRPIQITLQRALSSLGFFQNIRLLYHIIMSNKTKVTQEDVEKCKDKDLLESLLKEMAGEFPQLSRIFVDERDQYMAYVLQTLMQTNTLAKIAAWRNVRSKCEFQPLNVVAVVGIGHVKGIVNAWNSHINNSELLEIPAPSRTSRVLRVVLKTVVVSALLYGGYKAARGVYTRLARIAAV